MKSAGIDVGMLQVGNEISKGMMDNVGPTNDVWGNQHNIDQIGRYIKAGARTVRNTYSDALVTVHIETSNMSKYECFEFFAC